MDLERGTSPIPLPPVAVREKPPVLAAHATVDEPLKANGKVVDLTPDMGERPDRGPRIEAVTPFTEGPSMRLQVDTQKMFRAAALALSMTMPAAAGTPKHFPSEEARLLARLQSHDRTMEASRQNMNERDARNGRTPEVKAAEPDKGIDWSRAGASAGMIAATIGLGVAAQVASRKRQDAHEGKNHVHA